MCFQCDEEDQKDFAAKEAQEVIAESLKEAELQLKRAEDDLLSSGYVIDRIHNAYQKYDKLCKEVNRLKYLANKLPKFKENDKESE